MKIIYCIPVISTTGGVERVTSIKANWLSQRNYEVHIISKEVEVLPFFTYDSNVRVHCIGSLNIKQPSILAGGGGKQLLYSKLRNTLLKVKNLPLVGLLLERILWEHEYQKYLKLFHSIQPDIIVAQAPDYVLVEAMLKFRDTTKSTTKLILESHGFRYYPDILSGSYPSAYIKNPLLPLPLGKALLRKLGKKIEDRTENDHYRAVDAVVLLTEEDKPNYAGNTIVISNPITISPLKEIELTHKLSIPTKFIIAAGRYDPQKNFESLLNIWNTLHQKYPEWGLLIYGHNIPSGLGALAENLERVYLYDATPHIREEYLKASIYAMTSKFEGLPLVLLEAQAMGLPIVSYACPCGPKDIVTDGEDGFLICPGDEVDFANKLETLMTDESLRHQMSQKALQSSKRFDIHTVMTQWVKLFERL